MSVNVASIWAYAGLAYREDEAGVVDANRAKFLLARGWGYVEPLLGDGRTEVNRGPALVETLIKSARANGLAVVGWFTPRPTRGVGVEETVAMAHDCVQRYGIDAVRYQCEAEFEYSNNSEGGIAANRFGYMQELGQAHRLVMPTIPTCVYTRGPLHMADAWWARAWSYGMRAAVECYGVTETPVGPGYDPRPDFAAPAAAGSALPPIVGGWWYRVKLGNLIRLGRVTDDGKSVIVDEHGVYQLGSPKGPRMIDQFGNPKWGALLGFFPTSWLKIVVAPYRNPYNGVKPSGVQLAAEIRDWQRVIRKYGQASKGYSVWPGTEMETSHYDLISPNALLGAALLP